MHRQRRKFLWWLGGGLIATVGIFFLSMIRGILYRIKAETAPKYLPVDLPSGVTFHDDVIVYRDADEFIIMSARCTHLGCMVDTRQGEELVCPCHGSRYSMDGKVLTGPATRNLARLRYRIDSKEKRIVIEPPP
ncbi:MAG: Rieske (2Fe-2S) protein [Deltaproteobacteria bacterium]|nr:Rieske (2Fe-2S) protein [Deltaproteobacteria bacterium]MBW2083198.1 Rieske (2Fe-2S) protein [Deltaproteobacteria bacterium]